MVMVGSDFSQILFLQLPHVTFRLEMTRSMLLPAAVPSGPSRIILETDLSPSFTSFVVKLCELTANPRRSKSALKLTSPQSHLSSPTNAGGSPGGTFRSFGLVDGVLGVGVVVPSDSLSTLASTPTAVNTF